MTYAQPLQNWIENDSLFPYSNFSSFLKFSAEPIGYYVTKDPPEGGYQVIESNEQSKWVISSLDLTQLNRPTRIEFQLEWQTVHLFIVQPSCFIISFFFFSFDNSEINVIKITQIMGWVLRDKTHVRLWRSGMTLFGEGEENGEEVFSFQL
jgi:hypothetical protein